MSNPKGINRRSLCQLCGATDRKGECENLRCGWSELPPRRQNTFHDGAMDGEAPNKASPKAA